MIFKNHNNEQKKQECAPSHETTFIALRQVLKTYPSAAGGFTALRGIDLTINRGRLLGHCKPFQWVAVVIFSLASLKLLLHLLTASNYGLFVDELYFLACGQHLAWGYVDMPPLTALLAALARLLFADSVAGIHFIPALAGAGLLLLTGLLVSELGGKIYAQLLAGVAVIIAGIFLAAHSYLSMNAVEPLIWLGCAAILVRLVKTSNPRLWLWFGVVAGIGLMNKNTMLMFGAALLAGVLLTPARRFLFNRWFLLGGAIALLVFLPNLVWMFQHDFPMLELLANIRQNGRNVQLNPLQFLLDEVIFLHPLTLPLWLGGLGWFFFHPRGRTYRFVGWAFLLTFAILLATQGRTYYLAPAFPMLLAGGSVAFEGWLSAPRMTWLRVFYLALLIVGGIATMPLFLPVLQPEDYVQYARVLGMRQPRIENFQESPLPQLFADRFGWPEMAQTVAQVYQSLPPEDQTRAVVMAGNYGQAGAIDFYGARLGLPRAISGHQNYFYWGTRGYSGEVVIALGVNEDLLRRFYGSVSYAASTDHPYAMPYENMPVYICREPKIKLEEGWEAFKNWN